jgi:hypothetical protein
MNLLRFAYYLMLATFAPDRLQAIADREYEHERHVAESVVGTLWLMGIDPSPYLELRSAEICSLCNRETFIWFHHDQQCAICMRKWLDDSFKVSNSKGLTKCQ